MKNPFRRRPKPEPTEEAIMVWADAAISMAEEFTRLAAQPQPVPNSARVMIQYWDGPTFKLIDALVIAYQVEHERALSWVTIVRTS